MYGIQLERLSCWSRIQGNIDRSQKRMQSHAMLLRLKQPAVHKRQVA